VIFPTNRNHEPAVAPGGGLMTIISLKDGTRINRNQVLKYDVLQRGNVRFLLSDGTVVIGEPYGDVDEAFIQTFPAFPGFKAIYAHRREDGEYHYTERAVIAWLNAPAGIYPVFQGYNESDLSSYEVIVEPSGKVYDSEGDQYEDFDVWRSFFEGENLTSQSAAAA
jgi:hypothetical protein